MRDLPPRECAWFPCRNIIPKNTSRRTCSPECRTQYMGYRQGESWLDTRGFSLAERIINNQVSAPLTGSCWNWRGALAGGYPSIRYLGHSFSVRREAWRIWMNGEKPIPDGLEIVETCGNPYCIFYEHLIAVTARERGRWASEMGSFSFRRDDIGPEKVKELRRRLMAGERLKDLAVEVDMTDRGLSYILRGNRAGDPPLREEEREFYSRKRSPCRKVLTYEQVLEVQRRNEAGESAAFLARELKVDRSTMGDAIHKRGAYELSG